MARPGERLRLKDRIIDNISKTIKSIQELVFYQYKDPLLTGCDDSVVLYNGSRLCHKLCENLDHTLLHGLKNVMRGYWRVVKQLSPHAMVKEIDMLVNVTTDLGKGRAWLYASLNECLLESYIRLLCDNDKLLKKYYAKEALVLDRDRMSVLLTLASGLDCVTFKLEYDLPYLDLNAYPPRSRSNSEQDGDVSSDSSDSYLGHPSRYRSMSEVCSNSPLADFQLTNDSDSASLASLDVCQMKASTISADSGFSADGTSTNGTRQYGMVSIETVMSAALQNGQSADSASLSSLSSSSGDPDRHQRLENISSSFGQNDDAPLLEVIHRKGKKLQPGKSKRKKVERSSLGKSDTNSIQSHLHGPEKYTNGSKVDLAVGKGSKETSLEDIADISVLANVVKNVSCHCRQRETLSSDTKSDVSRTVFIQESGSFVRILTTSSGQTSTTSNLCAEASGCILSLSVEPKGCMLSRSECLPNSSNTAVAQDDFSSLRSRCLSSSSNTAVVPDGSPFSELCGPGASGAICGSGACSENSAHGLFSVDVGVVPDSCVGDDPSFKYTNKIKGNPSAALMPPALGCPKSCVADLNANTVPVAGEGPDVVDQQSQPNVMCDVSQVSVACDVQSQPDVMCVQDYFGACDQNNPAVTCVQSQPNVICIQSQPPDDAFDQGQQTGASVQSQPNGACVQSQPDVICLQNQHHGAYLLTQPDLTCVLGHPNTPDAKSQSGVTDDALQHTNSNCDEQVTMKNTVDLNGNEDRDSSCQVDEDVDVYSNNKQDASGESHSMSTSLEHSSEVSSVKSLTHSEDDSELILQTAEHLDSLDRTRLEDHAGDVDLSLRPDNNTVLQIMLDMFCYEDEQYLKMFVTWENQTEGGTSVAFLLISSHCLYLLHYQRTAKTFVQRSCTALMDIIFLSVGLNGQTLNIESRGKNKQKQRLWLTPGNRNLSQAIVACLAEAVKAANEHAAGKSRFSVGSEVPLQKIALRKYISKELSIKPQEVNLLEYSLVFWEDLSSASSSGHSVYKEGNLDLQTQDLLKCQGWKPVYIVLKNNILSVKNDKSEFQPHCFLSLGGDQCVGCRLTSRAGRDNCVELILAQGGSWLLSGASQADISDWRHALCLAVSQGTVGRVCYDTEKHPHQVVRGLHKGEACFKKKHESNIPTSCVPCCAVMSNQHLFLCHEDLYSRFHRTLARLPLADVTMIAVDGTDPTYCVIKFKVNEEGMSNRQWAFYFNSNQDLDRHMSAIRATWKDIHQTELPVLPLDDVAVECSCSSCSIQLKRQLTLS